MGKERNSNGQKEQLIKLKQQLQMMNDQNQAVINNVPCGLVKVRIESDGSSHPVLVNQTFLTMTGMSRDEMMELYAGDSCAGVHPEDISRIRKMMQGFRPGEKRTAVFRLRKGQNDWIWVRATSFIKEDADAMILFNSYLDISDEIENSLIQKRLLNELPGGVAIFRVSDRLECQYYNDGLADLFDFDRSALDNIISYDNYLAHAIAPEDSSWVLEELWSKTAVGAPINLRFRITTKERRVKWVHMTASKLREEDGLPIYYCIFTIPTEEAILYRDVVENSVSGILIGERKGRRVIFANTRFRSTYLSWQSGAENAKKSVDALLDQKEIDLLSEDEYKEFHRLIHGMYLAIRAKALIWNGMDAYVMYVTDETLEYRVNQKKKELIDLVPAGLGIYEVNDGKVVQTFLNERYYKMMLFTPEEYQKDTNGDFIRQVHPDDIPVVRSLLLALSGGRDILPVEFRNLRGDGSYLWVRLVAEVVRHDEKSFTVYCGYEDISEEVSSRQKLEASNQTLRRQYELELTQRRLLERDSAVYARYNVTKDILEECRVNDPLFYGLPEGINSKQIHAEISNRMYSGQEIKAADAFFNLKAVKDFIASGNMEHTLSYRSRQKDGILWWLKAVAQTDRDVATEDIIVNVYIKSENIEKRMELVTRSIVDEETDYVMLVSTVTDKAMFMWRRGDYIEPERKLYEQYPFSTFADVIKIRPVLSHDLDAVLKFYDKQTLTKRLKSAPVITMIVCVEETPGTIRRKKLRAFYMDDTKEDIVIVQGDITDLYDEQNAQKQRLEAALALAEKANRAKSDFLANMSHEIRTPMNAIIGMTELTMESTLETETKAALQTIMDSGKYMMSILNDILDMNRIENGKFTLDYEWIPIENVLSSCITMIQPAIDARHIVFEYPVLKKEPDFECSLDILKTQRMLMNLLHNACKFTPEYGHIRLILDEESRTDGNAVDRIVIEDNGCGMSEEFLERIFTPFAQERNRFSGSVQGTGLGLSLARQTARAMGGDITVESKLGAGSKFTIRFPYQYRSHAAKAEETKRDTTVDEEALNGAKILLCEDNQLNIVIAKKLLERIGCSVDTAENGRQGLELFTASVPGEYDAILMDIRMPQMDGLEASKAIRVLARPDAKNVPIIAMSANAFEEDIQMSLAAGMNAHLPKPVEPQKLYTTLASLLNKKSSRKA